MSETAGSRCSQISSLLCCGHPFDHSLRKSPRQQHSRFVLPAGNSNGKIGVTLFQNAQGFPDDTSKAFRQQSVEIDAKTMSAQLAFKDLPQGTFAVSVLHDENGNGKMDKNFVEIPKEGYGASNNPKKKRRAPAFDEAKFSLNSPEQTIEIALIY